MPLRSKAKLAPSNRYKSLEYEDSLETENIPISLSLSLLEPKKYSHSLEEDLTDFPKLPLSSIQTLLQSPMQLT